MHTEEVDTIIIGGGLSGIYAAFLLAAKKTSIVLLEARSRLRRPDSKSGASRLFC